MSRRRVEDTGVFQTITGRPVILFEQLQGIVIFGVLNRQIQ
ncbi:MAG: hypothetical protein ACOCVA_03055 [Prolixibacteraceae bacterium]